MTTRTSPVDPVRATIQAAIDRLLDGTPSRSNGRLSVSQLAVEAGVERWRLTHQHLDLRDQFQARVRELDANRASHAKSADALQALQQEHTELRRHCAALEDRLHTYAAVLNLLALENATLAEQHDGNAQLFPFQRHRPAPDPASPR
jgi:chromosome segregation ATPase